METTLVIGVLLGVCAAVSALFLMLSWFWAPSKLQLSGRHILIGGGSQGIGLELGKLLVAEGGSVSVVARNKDTLARAKAEVRGRGLDNCFPTVYLLAGV